MRLHVFGRYSGPLIGLGGLLAAACVVGTWSINRLQADLARAVRLDATRLEAAEELQIRLRQLRFRSLMAAADPSAARRGQLAEDRQAVTAALDDSRRGCDAADDIRLLDAIDRGFADYLSSLALDGPGELRARAGADLLRWADAHPVQGLLAPCRELADRQRRRMAGTLDRSEAQTTWAGRGLLALGLAGAVGGLVSGYATARSVSRRTARLSVRVRAVQAHLDQDVGAMTVVEGADDLGDLDAQLDHVVTRVKDVCRRLQEQERELLRAEQLAAVGHLAAGVAHEVRNPLTGIKFLVEAALRPGAPTALTAEDLGMIRHEIVRIERTVQGLLDYARTPPPVRRRLDLRDLVADAAGSVRGRAGARAVSVQVGPAGEPLPAAVDRDQFHSLLTNLLVNAIDATPTGGTVGVRACRGAGGMIAVAVTDTGPGIDPAVADRLFTPFATTKPTGTGLGLTVARRVALEHGGALTAANLPAGGACFTLTLPAAEAPDGEAPGRG